MGMLVISMDFGGETSARGGGGSVKKMNMLSFPFFLFFLFSLSIFVCGNFGQDNENMRTEQAHKELRRKKEKKNPTRPAFLQVYQP